MNPIIMFRSRFKCFLVIQKSKESFRNHSEAPRIFLNPFEFKRIIFESLLRKVTFCIRVSICWKSFESFRYFRVIFSLSGKKLFMNDLTSIITLVILGFSAIFWSYHRKYSQSAVLYNYFWEMFPINLEFFAYLCNEV